MPCPFNVGTRFDAEGRTWTVTACGPDWCNVLSDARDGYRPRSLVFDYTPPVPMPSMQRFHLQRETAWWWDSIPPGYQLDITRMRDLRRRQLTRLTCSGGANIQRGAEIAVGTGPDALPYRVVEVEEGFLYVELATPEAKATKNPFGQKAGFSKAQLEKKMVKPIPTRFERDLEIDDAG